MECGEPDLNLFVAFFANWRQFAGSWFLVVCLLVWLHESNCTLLFTNINVSGWEGI